MPILLRSLLVCSVLAFAGCATDILTDRDRAMMAGRYGEMQKAAEAEVPDMNRAPTRKLVSLCIAYAKVKRYDRLSPCLDQLERNVAAGDTNMTDMEAMQKKSPLMAGLAQLGAAMSGVKLEIDVSPFLWELRAETYMDLGEPRRAVEYGRKMYATIPTEWNRERYARIHALGILGLALAFSGERAQALERARELENVGTGYPYVLLKTDKQVFLARIYLSLGEYQRAYAIIGEDDNSFFRGLADMVSGGATLEGGSLFAFQQIQRKFMRSKSALEIGQLKEAKAGYDEMLASPVTQENGDLYWIVLYDRGRIAEREGDARAAIDFYRRAVDVIERQRSTLNTEASKIGFIGDKQNVYHGLVRALVAQGDGAQAFEYVERSKARALVDMLAAKKDFSVPSGNAEQVKALLAMADSAEADARALDAAEKTGQTRNLLSDTRRQLGVQAPELASLVSVTTLKAAELQSRIPAGETLLEYYYGGSDLYVFVATRESLRVVTLNGAGLVPEVQSFRRAVQDPVSGRWREDGQRLYARLLAPIEPHLATERLAIVAHGALHYLPFSALSDGKRFLIERHAVRLLPAASVLQFVKGGVGEKPGGLLALGNPDLGDARYNLAFAQTEAQAVAGSVPRSRALLRRDATETAFKEFAGGFRYLHIASHGEFNPDAPLNSALLLARDARNDGVLTVGELYSMRIDADLVTLSACETGLGKIAGGGDVVGLTRGFLFAGARSIVASLWQVDDRATGQLMSAFYDALRRGADKRDALRASQLAALKTTPHPFFWAAFGLTGEP
jgi:CHAT domain-containing protein